MGELSLAVDEMSIPEAVLHAWERVKLRLQKQMEKGGAAGKAQFYSWIRPISLSALREGEVFLSLPTPFMCAYVRDHFGDLLHSLWLEEGLGNVSGIEFHSPSPEEVMQEPSSSNISPGTEKDSAPAVKLVEKPVSANSLNPHYSFENFIVDKPNEVAHVCAKRVAEHPNSQGFNPLVLHGGVGLGKTHLMQAIGNEVSKDRSKTVEYMTADTFMYRYTNSLRAQRQNDFKEELISVDLLMIDDVQFLIGKTRTQEEFFNIFNELKSAGKQIVLTTDRSPHNQADFDDRVRSRLASGMIAALYDTTFELRLSILQAKAEDANVVFSEKVLEFLAHKITTNVRELEGAFNRLMAHATLMDRPITLEAAQEILKDMLRSHERIIGIDEIKRLVGDEWNVRLAQMNGKQRSKKIARPRQVAMYLAKVLTRHSLPEIGKKFERDHTTVMHAIRKVEQEMAEDPDFAEKVEQVQRMLKTGPSNI